MVSKKKMTGHNVSFSVRRTNRWWKPNIQWMTFHSELLDKYFQVRVSTTAFRCIKKMGGVDNYLLFTDEKEIDSAVGMELKKHLIPLWEKKNGKKYDPKQFLFDAKCAKVAAAQEYNAPFIQAGMKKLSQLTQTVE